MLRSWKIVLIVSVTSLKNQKASLHSAPYDREESGKYSQLRSRIRFFKTAKRVFRSNLSVNQLISVLNCVNLINWNTCNGPSWLKVLNAALLELKVKLIFYTSCQRVTHEYVCQRGRSHHLCKVSSCITQLICTSTGCECTHTIFPTILMKR